MLNMNRLSPMLITCALGAACAAAPESSLEFKSGSELPAAASQNSQAGAQPTAAVVNQPPAAAAVPPPATAPAVAAATPPPAAAPSAPVSVSAPVATAASPAATPGAGAAGSRARPSATTAAKLPVTPATSTLPTLPTTPAMTNPMTLPDGTVVYRIPDGTGSKDWNPRDKPIKVARGRTLRLIDDDKSVASGHWLHTNGQPCPHGLRAIGEGFDCVISNNAPLGVVFGTFEHNIANAGGQLYIDVVAPAAE